MPSIGSIQESQDRAGIDQSVSARASRSMPVLISKETRQLYTSLFAG